jgi:hypothetical protein
MFVFFLQVAHLNLPGSELFRKLRQLKSEKGGLTSQDERHFAQLRRSLEAEVLAHADVVSAMPGYAYGCLHMGVCSHLEFQLSADSFQQDLLPLQSVLHGG